MKDLTVFVLTHNRSDLVLETIYSILNQTCNDFKFVVSDNSSNDDTRKLLENTNLLNKFEYIKREKEYSSLDHFNLCLSEVETNYFMFFHDDDVMKPEMVEISYNSIDGTNYIASACNANFIKKNKKIRKSFNNIKKNKVLVKEEDLLLQYYKGKINPFPSYIYSKILIGNIRFDSSAGKYSDVVWLGRLLHKGKILWISNKLMFYRLHNGQDSSSYEYSQQLKLINFFTENIETSKGKKILRKYRIQQLYTIESKRKKYISVFFYLINSFFYLFPRVLVKKNLKFNK